MIIMTSNVGSQWILELGARDREEMERRVTDALRATFKPEFLNRIDEVIIFQNLSADQIGRIVEIQVERLTRRLSEHKIELVLSDGARALLARKGYDPIYGARPLKRAIQQLVENPLALEILKGKFPEGSRVRVDSAEEGMQFIREG
jgi:ATP-dependent Clp protease ATP-binding subunit ClpB